MPSLRAHPLYSTRMACRTCGDPCVVGRPDLTLPEGWCDAATDYVVLCDACYKLMRVAALLPFVDETMRHWQQQYLEEGMERLACRRLVNGRKSRDNTHTDNHYLRRHTGV